MESQKRGRQSAALSIRYRSYYLQWAVRLSCARRISLTGS